MDFCEETVTKRLYMRMLFEDASWIDSENAVEVGIAFAAASLVISTVHIVRHLRQYTMPQVQLYVIRILLTCPVYAITSSIALYLRGNGIYAEVVRDVYEAVVVYSFMNLILEYCGGETDCVYMMENEPPLRLPFPLCMSKPQARTMRLMRFCQRGVVQFILIQSLVAAASIALLLVGHYENTTWQGIQTVVYNFSYGWALYCLYVFYLAVKQNIKYFRPIAKFATVKLIVFATYYQSLFLKLTLPDREHAVLWNDFLLCVEMVVFATALMFAFPVTDFQGGIPNRRVLDNVKEVFTVNDILHDLYHNFTPAYGDYALQRSQGEMPGTAAGVMDMRRHRASSTAAEEGRAIEMPVHAETDRCPLTQNSTPTSPAHGHSLSGNLNPVAREMAQRYRGRSRRMSFNRLLRGTQPVRATLRTRRGPDGTPLGDIESGPGVDADEDDGGDGHGAQEASTSPGGCMHRVEECAHFSQYGICGGAEETKDTHPLDGRAEKDSIPQSEREQSHTSELTRIGRLSLALKLSRKSPPPGGYAFPVSIVGGQRRSAPGMAYQSTEPDSSGSDDSNGGDGHPTSNGNCATTGDGTGSKRGSALGASAPGGGSPYPLVTVNDLHRVDSCEWGEYA